MPTEYANLLSRLLMRQGFAYQFAFPVLDNRRLAGRLGLLERLLPRPGQVAPPVAPIFVVGLPRTGSTWLQTLLCAHPDMAYISHFSHHFMGCFRAANLVARVLGLDARAERFIGDSVVNSLHGPSEAMAYFAEWFGMDPACLYYDPLTVDDLDAATVGEIRDTLGRIVALFGPGKRFFCKNPGFIPYTPVLAGLFPDGRFLHLVRDPRPTANSMRKLLAACREQLAFIRRSGKRLAVNITDFIPYPRLPRLAEYVARFGADDIRTTARLWRDAAFFMENLAPTVSNLLTVVSSPCSSIRPGPWRKSWTSAGCRPWTRTSRPTGNCWKRPARWPTKTCTGSMTRSRPCAARPCRFSATTRTGRWGRFCRPVRRPLPTCCKEGTLQGFRLASKDGPTVRAPCDVRQRPGPGGRA